MEQLSWLAWLGSLLSQDAHVICGHLKASLSLEDLLPRRLTHTAGTRAWLLAGGLIPQHLDLSMVLLEYPHNMAGS